MQSMKNLLKRRFVLLTMVVVMMTGTVAPGYVETVQADTTVYVTRTGEKYHTHKCGNGTYYAASRSSALARGLTPCKKCFPYGDSGTSASSGSQSKRCKVRVEEPKLNHATLTMDLKDAAHLKLSGCRHTVKWYSDDSDIVKVSGGRLVAKDVGKTTVRAKVHGETYTCRVTVKKPEIKSITVGEYDTVMDTDAWQDVEINVHPSYARNYYTNISVKSSDPSVVRAEWYEGLNRDYIDLTSGETAGSATITVSMGEQSVSFAVRVREPENE